MDVPAHRRKAQVLAERAHDCVPARTLSVSSDLLGHPLPHKLVEDSRRSVFRLLRLSQLASQRLELGNSQGIERLAVHQSAQRDVANEQAGVIQFDGERIKPLLAVRASGEHPGSN